SVQLAVNDSVGNTWSWTDAVIADANGNFTDQLTLPDTFIANYSVTATGDTSGTATTSFTDTIGAGALNKPTGNMPSTGGVLNTTHWKVQAGDTITDTITGATDVTPVNGQVAVFVKSSLFGNTQLVGTMVGTTISFTWTVPSTSVCGTTNVAYGSLGLTTNNSQLPGGTGNKTAGFAVVDS